MHPTPSPIGIITQCMQEPPPLLSPSSAGFWGTQPESPQGPICANTLIGTMNITTTMIRIEYLFMNAPPPALTSEACPTSDVNVRAHVRTSRDRGKLLAKGSPNTSRDDHLGRQSDQRRDLRCGSRRRNPRGQRADRRRLRSVLEHAGDAAAGGNAHR